jgi:hypothetical protein
MLVFPRFECVTFKSHDNKNPRKMETIHNGTKLDIITAWYHGFDYRSYNTLEFEL